MAGGPSAASLAHEQKLKASHKLDNLRLVQGDIREVAAIDREFDFILCTGVLMHLADPDQGLRILRETLVPQGALLGMVCAQTRDGVAFVRQTIAQLPREHFVHWYTQCAD
ncbi:MAG: class I SAM-dependent methyltransferase [Burkholderiales bacterium]